ncbi:hypothetical protein B4U80_13574, partial [Leptotrombidium deliense]
MDLRNKCKIFHIIVYNTDYDEKHHQNFIDEQYVAALEANFKTYCIDNYAIQRTEKYLKDTIVVWSTIEKFESRRSSTKGTVFVNPLCDQLNKEFQHIRSHFKGVDLVEVLKFVQRGILEKVKPSGISQIMEYKLLGLSKQFNFFPKRVADKTIPCYEITKRGINYCLIINVMNFPGSPKRSGSDVDVKNIEKVMKKYQFTPITIIDPNFDIIKDKIRQYSGDSTDAFIMFVMTHGDTYEGIHYLEDHEGTVKPAHELLELLCEEVCINMQNKPKIVFFVSCRGDYSAHVIDEFSNDSTNALSIHHNRASGVNNCGTHCALRDVIVIWSTLENFVSHRHVHNGSVFIDAFSEVIAEQPKMGDLVKLYHLTQEKILEKHGESFRQYIELNVLGNRKYFNFYEEYIRQRGDTYRLHSRSGSGTVGLCYILNNCNSTNNNLIKRRGTHEDADKMQQTFEKLGYRVRVIEPTSTEQMYNIRDECVSDEIEKYKSLVIILLTNGNRINHRDIIIGPDGKYFKFHLFLENFNDENCAQLKNKPKLFIVQSSRG